MDHELQQVRTRMDTGFSAQTARIDALHRTLVVFCGAQFVTLFGALITVITVLVTQA